MYGICGKEMFRLVLGLDQGETKSAMNQDISKTSVSSLIEGVANGKIRDLPRCRDADRPNGVVLNTFFVIGSSDFISRECWRAHASTP